MPSPKRIRGARLCVLLHPDEVTICANSAGFKSIGLWMSWLADSNPKECFHFHLLWHLESEASRFRGARLKNVWFLRTPDAHQITVAPPPDVAVVSFDLTFQVVPKSMLDELAKAQGSGLIPEKYRKVEASYVAI